MLLGRHLGHLVVDVSHEGVRLAGQDRTAVDRPLLTSSVVPQVCERKRRLTLPVDDKNLFAALTFQPLVQSVGKNQRASLAERRLVRRGLRAGSRSRIGGTSRTCWSWPSRRTPSGSSRRDSRASTSTTTSCPTYESWTPPIRRSVTRWACAGAT